MIRHRAAQRPATNTFSRIPQPLGWGGCHFVGDKRHYDDFPENSSDEGHFIQVAYRWCIGPSGGFDDFFNHSCEPNSFIKIDGSSVVLHALKEILPGEEIVFDYSITMDEDCWEMPCNCGSKDCRGKIVDFKKLPSAVSQKYFSLGIVPDFIAQKSVVER